MSGTQSDTGPEQISTLLLISSALSRHGWSHVHYDVACDRTLVEAAELLLLVRTSLALNRTHEASLQAVDDALQDTLVFGIATASMPRNVLSTLQQGVLDPLEQTAKRLSEAEPVAVKSLWAALHDMFSTGLDSAARGARRGRYRVNGYDKPWMSELLDAMTYKGQEVMTYKGQEVLAAFPNESDPRSELFRSVAGEITKKAFYSNVTLLREMCQDYARPDPSSRRPPYEESMIRQASVLVNSHDLVKEIWVESDKVSDGSFRALIVALSDAFKEWRISRLERAGRSKPSPLVIGLRAKLAPSRTNERTSLADSDAADNEVGS